MFKQIFGSKASEQMGSAGVLGSVAYSIITGDLVGGAIGLAGSIGLRFRDEVNAVVDFGDRHIRINKILADAKTVEHKCLNLASIKAVSRVDPKLDMVKERIDAAAEKQLRGSPLTPDEAALLQMAQYIS